MSFASPAQEALADTITVGEYLVRDHEASFLLEVTGDAMEGVGILAGDTVIFERGVVAKPGDIVIVLTEDGYYMRYLRQSARSGKNGGAYFLEAANEKYENLQPKEGQIIGVVVATFRKYV